MSTPVTRNFLAFDLGAASGRAEIGRFDGERLTLEEVHRFANAPVRLPTVAGSSLHWDSLDQLAQVKAGIALGWPMGSYARSPRIGRIASNLVQRIRAHSWNSWRLIALIL